ncbi:Hypothetical protein HVR_LOCUS698 [uncultured virus]|nr:Hypothetical protein HVR_LOCUS698 [uncultured virus]
MEPSNVQDPIESWAIRHSLKGEELQKNHDLNRYLYDRPDIFQYHHEITTSNGKVRKFCCGTKYNSNDVSRCPFCQGHKYNRPKDEVMDVADGIFSMPKIYNMDEVRNNWKEGKPAEVMAHWRNRF